MHTTAVYQAAVAQLLIGEANFVGKQLELPGWRALQTTNEAKVTVFGPFYGVGGTVDSGDYKIAFIYGRLWMVERVKRTDGPLKNWPTREAFLQLRPVISTNESRNLVRGWLHEVGIDTNRLDQRLAFFAKQSEGQTGPSDGEPGRLAPGVMHYLRWSQLTTRPLVEHSAEVRADTRELWRLSIPDTNHFMTRKLVLTNVTELLGPQPSPRKFVHEMFGGPARFNVVVAPDRVEAELLNPNAEGGPLTVRRGPVRLSGNLAEQLSRALTDFDTYAWLQSSLCAPDYGVRMRFHQGDKKVEVLLCFQCSHVLIDGKPGAYFNLGHGELLQIVRSVFPGDNALLGVKSETTKREDYLRYMEMQLKEHEAKNKH